VIYMYEIVEVIDDFTEEQCVNAIPLKRSSTGTQALMWSEEYRRRSFSASRIRCLLACSLGKKEMMLQKAAMN
jgi:hypothetical protein